MFRSSMPQVLTGIGINYIKVNLLYVYMTKITQYMFQLINSKYMFAPGLPESNVAYRQINLGVYLCIHNEFAYVSKICS